MVKIKPRAYPTYSSSWGKESHASSQKTQAEKPAKPSYPLSVDLKTSKDAIFELLHAHTEKKAYTKDKKMGSVTVLKLDDITAYDISEDEETQLWEIEVDRLIQAFKDTETATTLSAGMVAFPEQTTKGAFDELSALADQLLINLHICRVDNGSVMYDLSQQNHNAVEYTNSFKILRDRQKEEDKPTPISNSNSSQAKYCALLDMATAICCRTAVAAFEDKDWQGQIISSLAKYSAKLKVLAMDSNKFIQRSMGMAGRSEQYKAMLKGVGDTLKHMRDDQTAAWNFQAEKEGKKRFAEDAGSGADDDDGIHIGGGGGGGGGAPFMAFSQHIPFSGRPGDGINMRSSGRMRMGMGMDMGMGNRGMGGMGVMGRTGPWNRFFYNDSGLKELEAFTKQSGVDEDTGYFVRMNIANNWTSSALMHILQELKTNFVRDLPSDCFDICSVVYEAGTVACTVPVLIHQDRGAELSGTNNMNLIQYSYIGFWLASQAAMAFDEAHGTKPTPYSSSSTVTFELQSDEPEKMRNPVEVRLHSFSEALHILIPLLCTTPHFTEILKTSITELRGVLCIDVEEHLLPKAPRFTGFVSLKTPKYKSMNTGFDLQSLTGSVLVEKNRHAALALSYTTQVWDQASASQREYQVQDIKARQTQLAKKASDWEFEETAIRVNCGRYVYTVLGVCTVFAVGGLMLGIFLGTFVQDSSIALQGVDPFGFTSYAWIIAAFIMLVAKSVRVVEWPWRDFLLRRVTCRTLSELRAVTGIGEQDLLTYLITTEYENVLVTKGPFNSIFTRRDAQGFSIDCKPEMRTLLASGIIFVKVLVGKEPALVCLDLRAGSTKGRSSIRHSGSMSSDDIFCRYPPNKGDRVQDVVLNQRQRHWDYMRPNWNRILGIYHDWDRKVR
ncbi:hypothetical protein B0I35DRAFT_445714 [Stachybotrys elegans]|uniref:Uncharacterized protein n=1 Tax=Stachybotrys elegans TaxID=80388 RepID=A0A8K0WL90_9HYPO|nr:hypothetical protein B0I35DRAFT_445714 [Stachybotrys elegans]